MTDLILIEKDDGLFVAILKDTDVNRSHAVGIDVGKQVIYDCMEEKVFVLNKDSLYICCSSYYVIHQTIAN